MNGTDLLIVGLIWSGVALLVGLWCRWTERPETQDWTAESGERPKR